MIASKDPSRSPTVTPVGAVARRLVAGAVGTAAMDTFLFAGYRRHGGVSSAGEWESSPGVTSWEEAPAPEHVGKRLLEGVFGNEVPPARATGQQRDALGLRDSQPRAVRHHRGIAAHTTHPLCVRW
jgi:hypothetical protein